MANKKVHDEFYESKGIHYQIEIYEVGTKFLGNWICTECGKKGGSSKLCETINDAIKINIQNLSTHELKHKNQNT